MFRLSSSRMVSNRNPKIVLLGSRGSGKSTFIGHVSGIYLGTATVCPIEWHLSYSKMWSATVSVGHRCTDYNSSIISFDTGFPHRIGDVCATPSQLRLLLKQAELSTIYAGIDLESIFHFSEEEIDRALTTRSSLPPSVIYITLQTPRHTTGELTLVDMPGLSQSGTAITLSYTEQLLRSYICQSQVIKMALMLPIDADPTTSKSLSLARSIDKDGTRTTVILTNLERSPVAQAHPFLTHSYPSQILYFYAPPAIGGASSIPFTYTTTGINRLRQDEAAFFRFTEPWSSRIERDDIGIRNILQSWSVTPSPSLTTHHPHFCRSVCMWAFILVIFICALSLALSTSSVTVSVVSKVDI